MCRWDITGNIEMKKYFMAALLLLGLVAGAMVFCSFNTSKDNERFSNVQFDTNAPVYWKGNAHSVYDTYIYIMVYQSQSMCNSFYAVDEKGNEYVVKENPYYKTGKYNSSSVRELCNYYISGGYDYYFSM